MKIKHYMSLAAVASSLGLGCLGLIPGAQAGVSTDEAAKLKTTLTPLGAERAGNADGSIPAWDGGYTKVPAGFVPGNLHADPFPNEKPLFSITAQNMDKYADKLSVGDKELFKRYLDYRMDVYPTHRTAAAPQWVYDNTYKNALNAHTTNGGNTLAGAYGGVPFPIPKEGVEIVWNHLIPWEGEAAFYNLEAWVVTSDGKRVLATAADQTTAHPYYFKEKLPDWDGDFWWNKQIATGPSFKVGESILIHDNVDWIGVGRQAWQYLTGQRRVRKAPTIGFDTPDFVMSGVGDFDEAFVFLGSPERYNWKILGKKEMYVPYNNNRFASLPYETVLGDHHLNPDTVRYELHRVWAVEATLAPGKRNVVARRIYYFDEDTYLALEGDSWDAAGQLWRHYYNLTLLCPEIPAVVGTINWGLYNFQSGAYVLNNGVNMAKNQFKMIPPPPAVDFSPDALAGASVR